MKAAEVIRLELNRIAARNGGVLQPKAVVEAARAASSPLHSRFEWDNSKAAQAYRIWQARKLISITITMIDGTEQTPDRMWVSLKADRSGDDGGYRKLITVLSDAEMRKQLLAEAIEEMDYFREKYGRLKELAEVFRAMARTRKKIVA